MKLWSFKKILQKATVMYLTVLVFPIHCSYHYFHGTLCGFLLFISVFIIILRNKCLEGRNFYSTVVQTWFGFFLFVFLPSITLEKLLLKPKIINLQSGGKIIWNH